MLLKHPEILYGLFLLLIPIIIHLFQLRRFQKVAFTNVAFLQKVVVQSRKSSQLKKWLTLLTRLLIFSALILAFTQPYLPHSESATKKQETAIYLDNSFSMQMPGKKGSLLQQAVQEIITNTKEEQLINVVTNDKTFKGLTKNELKEELLSLDFSPKSLQLENAYQKAKNLLSEENTEKKVVLISDFQQAKQETINQLEDDQVSLHLVQLTPENTRNFSVDEARLSSEGNQNELHIQVNSLSPVKSKINLSVYNDEELLGKKTLEFDREKSQSTTLSLEKKAFPQGRIEIEDRGLTYDNELFFSINEQETINVLSVSEKNTSSRFLKRIYSNDEFNFSDTSIENLDFAALLKTDVLILNGLNNINPSLLKNTLTFVEEGGVIILIPGTEIVYQDYQELLSNLELPYFNQQIQEDLQITNINFDHYLFDSVFLNQVNNFDYPSVQKSYSLTANNYSALRFSNQSPFLIGKEKAFLFTGNLVAENTNFTASPLIVPTFYNMAKKAFQSVNLYAEIGKEEKFRINTTLSGDQVIHLKNPEEDVIPLQQKLKNYTQITTNEVPSKSGNFEVTAKDSLLKYLSFNFNRNESDLQYLAIEKVSNHQKHFAVTDFFDNETEKNKITELWMWFLIFALIFLIIEMLILRFVK